MFHRIVIRIKNKAQKYHSMTKEGVEEATLNGQGQIQFYKIIEIFLQCKIVFATVQKFFVIIRTGGIFNDFFYNSSNQN